VNTDQPWQARGNCRNVDPETMFPETGDLIGRTQAKATCRGCKVLVDCLEWALEANVEHGVWGGLDEDERRKLRRSRRRLSAVKTTEPAAAASGAGSSAA